MFHWNGTFSPLLYIVYKMTDFAGTKSVLTLHFANCAKQDFDILIAFRVIQSCNFGLTFKHNYKLSLLIQFCNYEASYVSLSSYLSARLKEYEFLACNLDLDKV